MNDWFRSQDETCEAEVYIRDRHGATFTLPSLEAGIAHFLGPEGYRISVSGIAEANSSGITVWRKNGNEIYVKIDDKCLEIDTEPNKLNFKPKPEPDLDYQPSCSKPVLRVIASND